MMTSSETLRVRVDKATAKRVEAWAKAHGTDVSGTLRAAIEKLLAEADRARRVEEAMARMRQAEAAGVFDPPKDDSWKASGGWR